MATKVNLGINRKVGLPNYGSRGASCHVEFEVEGPLDDDWEDRFRQQSQSAWDACRKAVDAELASDVPNHIEPDCGEDIKHRPTATPVVPDNSTVRMATASQIRAIYAIANQKAVNLDQLLRRYDVTRPHDLSISQASGLIDAMKSATHNGAAAVPEAVGGPPVFNA